MTDRFIAKLHVKFCFHKHGLSGTRRDPWFVCSMQSSLATPPQMSPPAPSLKGVLQLCSNPSCLLLLLCCFPCTRSHPSLPPVCIAHIPKLCVCRHACVRAHAWGKGGQLGWSSALARKTTVGCESSLPAPVLPQHPWEPPCPHSSHSWAAFHLGWCFALEAVTAW